MAWYSKLLSMKSRIESIAKELVASELFLLQAESNKEGQIAEVKKQEAIISMYKDRIKRLKANLAELQSEDSDGIQGDKSKT